MQVERLFPMARRICVRWWRAMTIAVQVASARSHDHSAQRAATSTVTTSGTMRWGSKAHSDSVTQAAALSLVASS